MSFKLFVYYCAVCGGWAALLAWALIQVLGLLALRNDWLSTSLIGSLLGMLLAAAIGSLDALLNGVGWQRFQRVGVCLGIGLLGGFVGGWLGEVLHQGLHLPRFAGWMLVGMAIGASIGVFDWAHALGAGQAARTALRKVRNGILGGALGGLTGGLFFEALKWNESLPRSSLAIGLVILGACIGLWIGLAQVILKEAWVRVEAGFRAGREMLLAKAETTIGRAEACDIGLFGDAAVEPTHARILLQGNRYVLVDAGTEGGTFLNDALIRRPAPLRSGDAIWVGNSLLRFGERQKR
jgi:hypothetical protein